MREPPYLSVNVVETTPCSKSKRLYNRGETFEQLPSDINGLTLNDRVFIMDTWIHIEAQSIKQYWSKEYFWYVKWQTRAPGPRSPLNYWVTLWHHIFEGRRERKGTLLCNDTGILFTRSYGGLAGSRTKQPHSSPSSAGGGRVGRDHS